MHHIKINCVSLLLLSTMLFCGCSSTITKNIPTVVPSEVDGEIHQNAAENNQNTEEISSYFRDLYVGKLNLITEEINNLPLWELERKDSVYIIGGITYEDVTPDTRQILTNDSYGWGLDLDMLEPIARIQPSTVVFSAKNSMGSDALMLLVDQKEDVKIWLAKEGMMDICAYDTESFIAYSYEVGEDGMVSMCNSTWAEMLFEYHTSASYDDFCLVLDGPAASTVMRYVNKDCPALFYDIYYCISEPSSSFNYPHVYVYSAANDWPIAVEIPES